jgi:hypothetical protein
MKWIALSILIFIVVYTFLTLKFRRSGHGTEPYHDAKERVTTSRLLSAGYHRITATAARLSDAQRPPAFAFDLAQATDGPGGLPEDLEATLIDKPTLPQAFGTILAPAHTNATDPYAVQFTCLLPDNKALFADAFAYLKEDEIAIVTNFERLEGDLATRTKDATVLVTIPANTLPSGNYRVTLVGLGQTKRWTLQVH